MIDPNILRKKLILISENFSRRGVYFDVKKIEILERKRKKLQIKYEFLQSEQNKISKEIGFKKLKKVSFIDLLKKVSKLSVDLKKIRNDLKKIYNQIYNFSLELPNFLDKSVPNGKSSIDNVEISRWGKIKDFNFSVKSHVHLGKINNKLDFLVSSKLSGSRFVVMRGKIAFLHRAIIQFMLNLHVEKHNYLETYVPYLANYSSLYGSAQLPKFSEDLFYVGNLSKKKLFKKYILIPTGEVPLVNLVRDQILDEDILPVRLVAHTPCFRYESGTYGKKEKGLIRMHQFDKVELVQIVKPESSMSSLEELTWHAETVLRLLDLPYRKVNLCSGDIGFSSCKTYDLEVWFPSKKKYYEISSCSNTSDFQSRRMKVRFRIKESNKKKFVHILNGSGLAVSRTLAAIMENYQDNNGKIIVPDVLKPYMNGIKEID